MKDSTNTIINIAKVVGVNASAISVSLASVNQLLTTISVSLATIYTIYKFIKDIKTKKNA